MTLLVNGLRAQLRLLEERLHSSESQARDLSDQLEAQQSNHSHQQASLRGEIEKQHSLHSSSLRDERVRGEELKRELQEREAVWKEKSESYEREVKALRERVEALKPLPDQVEALQRELKEAQVSQEKNEETRVRLQEFEGARARFLEEKKMLDEDRKRMEEEKRRVEDQRRQYEKAGTDVLKVLNDANQKIIALEEHKWKLEDQCVELRLTNEKDKKTFEQKRIKLEQEVEMHKQEAEKETALRQEETKRIKEEVVVLVRERNSLEEKLQGRTATLLEREREIQIIQGRVGELDRKCLEANAQYTKAQRESEKERNEWKAGKDMWDKERDVLRDTVEDLQTEKTNLEKELDINRKKFENLKQLLG